jgi:hypothetical protein
LLSWLAPFWTAIVFMVLVLLLVFYIILSMMAQVVRNLVQFFSVVYAHHGGTHDGENDDRRIP